jgi:hypothetical protein
MQALVHALTSSFCALAPLRPFAPSILHPLALSPAGRQAGLSLVPRPLYTVNRLVYCLRLVYSIIIYIQFILPCTYTGY